MQDRSYWASIVKEVTDKLNVEAEELEMQKKDEQRRRREEAIVDVQDGVKCVEPHCAFVARNEAGLVNHRRQKHSGVARLTLPCRHCGRQFKKQGLPMHERFCNAKAVRTNQ